MHLPKIGTAFFFGVAGGDGLAESKIEDLKVSFTLMTRFGASALPNKRSAVLGVRGPQRR
jgi:hypothetical protein